MARIGFWTMLFDPEISGSEASAINAAYDSLDALGADLATARGEIARLQTTVAAQRTQLLRAQAALEVLATTLVEAGVTSEAVLDARLEAAIDAVAPRPTATGPTTPCARCGGEFPLAALDMTGDGPMCARCAAA